MTRPKGFPPAVVTLIWDRDNGLCGWCGKPVHGERGLAWSIHHRRPRASGGTSLEWVNMAANGVILHGNGTQGCHAEVESNRARALGLGFLILTNGRGAAVDIPIRHAVHGTAHLTNDGRAVPISDPLFAELMAHYGQSRGVVA